MHVQPLQADLPYTSSSLYSHMLAGKRPAQASIQYTQFESDACFRFSMSWCAAITIAAA